MRRGLWNIFLILFFGLTTSHLGHLKGWHFYSKDYSLLDLDERFEINEITNFNFLACPTDYTITYPEKVCVNSPFDVTVELFGGSGPYDIDITDGSNIIGSETSVNGSIFIINIPLGLPFDGNGNNISRTLFANITENGNACPDVIRTSSSSDLVSTQGGSYSRFIPFDPVCFGEPFTITLTATEAAVDALYTFNLTYNINGNITNLMETSSLNSFDFVITPITAGEYFITSSVTDDIMCGYFGPFNVPVVTVLEQGLADVYINLPSEPTCEGEDLVLNLDIFGSQAPYNVVISENSNEIFNQQVGVFGTNNFLLDVDLIDPIPGNYDYDVIISDNQNCSITSFYAFDPEHEVLESPAINTTSIQECQQNSNDQVTIDLTAYEPELTLFDSVNWNFDSDGSIPINNPTSFEISGSIIVYAQTENSVGCTSEYIPIEIELSNSFCGSCMHPDVPNLIAFYNSLKETNWIDSTGWATTIDETNCNPCDSLNDGANAWFGLTCKNNRVTQIQLNNNNLTGEIILLNDLDSLELISLADNNIEGGNWNFTNEKLYSIGIGGNNLKTTIPDFNLPNLEQLICYSDSLVGPLPSFQNVPKLREVFVYDNPFGVGIPNWQLDSLRGISFYNCGMTGEIPELESSIYIEEIFFDFNQLTGSIPAYEDKLLLDTFILNNNDLSGCMLLDRYCTIDSFDFRENTMMAEGGINTPLCTNFEEDGSVCKGFNGVFDSLECACNCNIAAVVSEFTIDISNSPLTSSMIMANDAPCTLYFNEEATDTTLSISCDMLSTSQVVVYVESGQSVWFDLMVTDVDTFTSDSIMFPLETINTSITGATVSNFSPEFISENSFYNISETNVFYTEDLCSDISVAYSDVVITEIQDSFKIIRTFVIDDNSLGNSWEFIQVIENYPQANPCLHPDYAALEAFYQSTNGDGWNNNNGWLSNCDPCGRIEGNDPWYGLLCQGSEDRVTCIDMFGVANCGEIGGVVGPDNNLIGELTESLGELTELRFLDIQESQISGIIPSSITNLNKLQYIDLSETQINGPLPLDLDKLQNVAFFDFANTRINDTLPESITNMGSLEYLYGNNSGLSGRIPSGLNNLQNIEWIDFSNNQLSGEVPSDLGLLNTGLNEYLYLDLSNNNLEKCIPSTFSALCGVPIFPDPDVNFRNNPLMPNGGDYWDEFCDDQDQEGQPCGIALDSIIQDCQCVSTSPCPAPICKAKTTAIVNDENTSSISLSQVLDEGFDILDCYSFDPSIDIDTFPIGCDDACTIQDITVYNLDTGESCTSSVRISKTSNICGGPSNSEASVELVVQDYTEGEFLFVDVMINEFTNVTEYNFDIDFNKDIFSFEEATDLNTELEAEYRFISPFGTQVINILPKDESQFISNIDTPTKLATLSFRILNQSLCESASFYFSSDGFGNVVFSCENFLEPVNTNLVNTTFNHSFPEPTFSPQPLEICSGDEITVTVTNPDDYQSINWDDSPFDELIVSPNETTNYDLTLLDNAGCSKDTFITISVIEELSITIQGVTSQCDIVNQTLSTSSNFQTYEWSLDGSPLNSDNENLTINEPGEYTLSVTDNQGCTGSNSIIVELQTSPITGITTDTYEVCNSSENGNTFLDLNSITLESGSWSSTETTIDVSNQSSVDFDGISEGSYELTFTTNTAIEPCEEVSQIIMVTVSTCSECECVTNNPPQWIDPPNINITISCNDPLPEPIDLEYTNSSSECLIQDIAQAIVDSSGYESLCGGIIIYNWSATICGITIDTSQIITIESPGTLVFDNAPATTIDITCNQSDLDLYDNLTIDYMLDTGSDCIPAGSVAPIKTENYDECGGTITYTWSVSNPCDSEDLTHTLIATVAASDSFVFIDPPIDITLSCNQLPFVPDTLFITNNIEGECSVSQEIKAVSVVISEGCPGQIINTWAFENPCTGVLESHDQVVTLVDCAAPTLQEDYIEVRAGDINDIDLFENDFISDSVSTRIVETERVELFSAIDYNEDGVFEFVISKSFFDTIRVTYEVCNLDCDNCTTATLKIVDEALKDIVLTDIFTPNGDGQNDALRFNFEDEIVGSQLYIYNRWGDKIYEQLNYTNDWDASGYPGGVYFYVLRIGDATVKKTLTVVK